MSQPPIERSCWCGSSTAFNVGQFHLEEGGAFSLARCDGCGVFALHPQPNDQELLKYYSAEYYGSSRRKFVGPIAALVGWFQGGRARIASRLLQARKGGRVLDVGCGNGGFLMQMKRRGFEVEGTEWTAQSAARIPPETGITVHVGDLLSLDLPERSYDLITLWHVFEHLRQPHEILMKIRRLLKPGGALVLSLPNAESMQAQRFGTAWLHHDPPRHLFGFGPKSLHRLLKMTDFNIESISTFSLEQNPFGFIQSWLNARGHPRDRLYAQLKGLARRNQQGRFTDLLWLGVWLAPAVLISTVESMRGRGATMTVQARLGDE